MHDNFNKVKLAGSLITIKKMKQYIKKNIKKNWEIIVILALFAVLVTAYFPLVNSRLTENVSFNTDYSNSDNRALSDRIFYNNVSRETISNNFIAGSGPGTFIFQIVNYSPLERGKGCVENNIPQNLEYWEYQPVHNIYLLICSEIGIVGFAIFCLIIMEIMSNSVSVIRKMAKTRENLSSRRRYD